MNCSVVVFRQSHSCKSFLVVRINASFVDFGRFKKYSIQSQRSVTMKNPRSWQETTRADKRWVPSLSRRHMQGMHRCATLRKGERSRKHHDKARPTAKTVKPHHLASESESLREERAGSILAGGGEAAGQSTYKRLMRHDRWMAFFGGNRCHNSA